MKDYGSSIVTIDHKIGLCFPCHTPQFKLCRWLVTISLILIVHQFSVANCDSKPFAKINLSLHPNCERLISPHMLSDNNPLVVSNPEYYQVELYIGNGLLIPDNILRMQHVGGDITALVSFVGPASVCPKGALGRTTISLKSNDGVSFTSTGPMTVYCFDPFLDLDPNSDVYPNKPIATQACGASFDAKFAGDWIEIHDCVLGDQDTSRTIFRQWWAESKQGIRFITTDTIFVLRLPPMTDRNVFCMEKDSFYCNDSSPQVGPFMVVSSAMQPGVCDTIYFLDQNLDPIPFDPTCGLMVKVDTTPFQGDGCGSLRSIDVSIFQHCYGKSQTECLLPPDISDIDILGGDGEPLIATCSFWLMEKDTLPPLVVCDLDRFDHVEIINGRPTAFIGSREDLCAAYGQFIPDAITEDQCGEVTQVKAMVDGLGVVALSFDIATGKWSNNEDLNLDVRTDPYLIILEAVDECGNSGYDTCAILIKDQTPPTVVTHDGFSIELPGKWGTIDTAMVDNGSRDNCGVDLRLVRRSDWKEHWTELCNEDFIVRLPNPGEDTLWCRPVGLRPSVDDLERFYAEETAKINGSGSICKDLIFFSWMYDLCKEATLTCKNSMSASRFDSLFLEYFPSFDPTVLAQIGGGWGFELPVTCSDVCTTIDAEILVMDYWCNWSIGSTTVSIEDDDEIDVVTDLEDISISCYSYQSDSVYLLPGFSEPQPLARVVAEAAMGSSYAKSVLDSALGTYVKAWEEEGDYVDANGDVIEPTVEYLDRGKCVCSESTIQVRAYDGTSHEMIVVDSTIEVCQHLEEELTFDQGIVLVNCSENTFCGQTLVADLVECGVGTITRTFKLWKTCGNKVPVPVTTKIQRIEIEKDCTLSRWMFDLPSDTIVYTCTPEISGSQVLGDVHPDSIGRPKFSFDEHCYNPEISFEDDLRSILVGEEECYLVQRTWYFADWCLPDPLPGNWWEDPVIVSDSFLQLIILRDTVNPVIEIEVAGEVDDVVNLNQCFEPLPILITFFDTCGLQDYSITIDTLDETDAITKVGPIFGNSDGKIRDTIELDFADYGLKYGEYRITAEVNDHCLNLESAADSFQLICSISKQVSSGEIENESWEVEESVKSWKSPALFQNRPNPFSLSTAIGFYIPKRDHVNIWIYDARGRLIKQIGKIYEEGYWQLDIGAEDLKESGVLYYTLQTSEFTQTKRMVKIPKP